MKSKTGRQASKEEKGWKICNLAEFSPLNALLEPESAKKRVCTLISALVTAILTALAAALFLYRLFFIAKLQYKRTGTISSVSDTFYDVGCLPSNSLDATLARQVSDVKVAKELMRAIFDEC